MSLQDAAAMISVQQAQDRIMQDPSLTLWGKVKAVETINRAARSTPVKQPWVTPGQVIRGAIGAAIGYKAGDILARYLGADEGTAQNARRAGIGLGTLLNTGVIGMPKTAAEIESIHRRDARNAVMLGFLKGARDSGLIENRDYCAAGITKKVAYVAVTPDVFTAPVTSAASTTRGIAATAGGLGAHIMGEDSTDEKIQRMMVEKRQLDAEAERLRAARTNRLLQKVLSRRVEQLTGSRIR
jgi:hypothetical protein